MRSFLSGLVAAAALGCAACATTVPSGPSVMVLPGSGKPFEQFVADDGVCRSWALQQVQGMTPGSAGAAETSGYEAQRRYDIAYMQCMYAKGHQIPVSGGLVSPTDVPPPPPPANE